MYTSREVYEFISEQTNDPIIERKNCAVSGQPFAIFQSDLDFYNKISPTFAGQKFQIPAPTLCPEERAKRRLCRRNESKLYKRSDVGKVALSIYSPDKIYNIVSSEYRRSDSWDPFDYGFSFDKQKGFFEQFQQLIFTVPTIALNVMGNENCDYVNCCGYSKNCYLSYNVDYSENMLYSSNCLKCSDGVDLYQCHSCVLCYESIDLHNCYKLWYSQSCSDCKDSWFLSHCHNCDNCYGCINLTNQSFCIFNKQYTKEEYEKEMLKLSSDSFNEQQNLVTSFFKIQIYRSYNGEMSNWCIGNYMSHDNNVVQWFDTHKSEYTKYTWVLDSVQHSQDRDHTWYNGAWCYQLSSCGDNIYNTAFSVNVWSGSDNVYYCILCIGIKDCFGCVGLRNKQYCIFNKQYTKEAYEKEVAEIINHMEVIWERWEFFPSQLSPFGYNETLAQEYYPLSQSWAFQEWFHRSTYSRDPEIPSDITLIRCWYDIMPILEEITSHTINTYIFVCKESQRPYRLTLQEVNFYKKYHLSIPELHPDIRHQKRVDMRQWRILHLRRCDRCNKELLSAYSLNYEGKVYCEECYQQTFYS